MMLAYAANRPDAGRRQSSPNALLLVISAHVALVAVVMSARMDLPGRVPHSPIPIIYIPPPVDPLPRPIPHPIAQPAPQPPLPTPLPQLDRPIVTPNPIDTGPMVVGDGGTAMVSGISDPIKIMPVHHEPRLLTPRSELKPPYPASKLASEEEATLTLRLTIDDQGRVAAVDPVGRADPVFVAAARRHLMLHWRYSPASEDGRAIASSITVTLKFMLDG
jgi:protein TonB